MIVWDSRPRPGPAGGRDAGDRGRAQPTGRNLIRWEGKSRPSFVPFLPEVQSLKGYALPADSEAE